MVRQVLFKRPLSFERPKMMREAISCVVLTNDGLFSAEGSQWQRERKATACCFTKKLIEQKYDTVELHVQRMLDGWAAKLKPDEFFVGKKRTEAFEPLTDWCARQKCVAFKRTN